jgi:hypothetical protein
MTRHKLRGGSRRLRATPNSARRFNAHRRAKRNADRHARPYSREWLEIYLPFREFVGRQ